MGKVKKSFRQYTEENEDIRKRPIKKESRHNYKTHLIDVVESEDWDELEDEFTTNGRIHRR